MKAEKFDQILQTRVEKMIQVLGAKADEYATDRDRLHNFKRAGQLLNCSPERALIGMLTKHLVSILDIVDNVESGKKPTVGLWDEKIGDVINYCVLLDGLVNERGFSK